MTAAWDCAPAFDLRRFGPERHIEVGYSSIYFSSNPERTGTEWHLHSLSGWWDPAVWDVDQIKAGRGVRTVTRTLAPRQVGWTGLVKCPTPEDLVEAMDQFRRMASTEMTVDETGLGQWREATQVRVTSASVTALTDLIGSYSVSVSCDEPLLFSAEHVELDPSASVKNVGDSASYPKVFVTGPTSGAPKVSIGSWSVTAPRSLGSGEQMIVDCGEGELIVGGSPVFPILTAWPSIAPGATVTVSTSRGTGYVKRVSAWR